MVDKLEFQKVYFSHTFGNNPDNVEHLTKKLEELYKKAGHILEYLRVYPVSPVNSFSYAYAHVSYDYGMELCLDALSECAMMVTFDGFDNSKGVNIEKEFCKLNDIPVVEYKKFLKDLIELEKNLKLKEIF